MEICKIFQITKVQTSSYHPQTNASAERMNSTINKTLRAFVDSNQKNWDTLLPSVMSAYRISPNTSTKMAPYFVVFGKDCTLPLDTALLPNDNLGKDARGHFDTIVDHFKLTRSLVHQNIHISLNFCLHLLRPLYAKP